MTAPAVLSKSDTSTTTILGFAGIYFLVLLILLPRLSLWLDEIHDLHGVRFVSFAQLPAYTANDGGGVPLGAITQLLFVRAFGYSSLTGRLASAVFSGECPEFR